jgi:hypothetical protein
MIAKGRLHFGQTRPVRFLDRSVRCRIGTSNSWHQDVHRVLEVGVLHDLAVANLAALYREKVATLASALQNADSRSEAAEALRDLVDAIVLVPAGKELRIELKGNLAAMLSAAQNAKRSPEGDLSLQMRWLRGRGAVIGNMRHDECRMTLTH